MNPLEEQNRKRANVDPTLMPTMSVASSSSNGKKSTNSSIKFTEIKTNNPAGMAAYRDVRKQLNEAKIADKKLTKKYQRISEVVGAENMKPTVHQITSIHPALSDSKIAGLVSKAENKLYKTEMKIRNNRNNYIAVWKRVPSKNNENKYEVSFISNNVAGVVRNGINFDIDYSRAKPGLILRAACMKYVADYMKTQNVKPGMGVTDNFRKNAIISAQTALKNNPKTYVETYYNIVHNNNGTTISSKDNKTYYTNVTDSAIEMHFRAPSKSK